MLSTHYDHSSPRQRSALQAALASYTYTSMQNNPAPPTLPVWTAMTVARNALGYDEAFAIGPDGYVWSYLTNVGGNSGAQPTQPAESPPDGRLISTGLAAQRFVLAKLAQGRTLLVGALGTALEFVQETGEPEPRWHAPVAIVFEGLADAVAIEGLHALERDDDVLIGVLARYASRRGPDAHHFWVGKWTGQGVFFRSTPVDLNGDDPVGNEFLSVGNSPSLSAKKRSFDDGA